MNADKIIAVRTGKTVYKDRDTVLKVFDCGYTQSHVLHEALNQTQVREVGLNVPRVLEVIQLDGKWAIRSEYIPGKTLQRLMEENPADFDKYFNLFVDIQREILSKQTRLLGNLKDEMNRIIMESSLEATVRYELHTRLHSMPIHKKICHGDFNPSNIIIKPDGAHYILDWSHATQGNASADAALTYLWFRLNEQNENSEKYLDLYCEKSGTDKEYVKKWIPIVAASQSVEENPHKREFLLKWVKFIDE
ncbi:MAG: phosphotransferase family protein [Bacillota bacterium]